MNNGKYNVTLIHTVKKTQVRNEAMNDSSVLLKPNCFWLATIVLECHAVAVLLSDLSQSRILAINSIGVMEPEPERDLRLRRGGRARGRSYLRMVTRVPVIV